MNMTELRRRRRGGVRAQKKKGKKKKSNRSQGRVETSSSFTERNQEKKNVPTYFVISPCHMREEKGEKKFGRGEKKKARQRA